MRQPSFIPLPEVSTGALALLRRLAFLRRSLLRRTALSPRTALTAALASVSALQPSPTLADIAPSGHAPAGVMLDHLHKQGELMLGYRFMQQKYKGLYHGSDKIDATQLAAAGYSMIPTGMNMTMHMFDIMYAPSDNLTLMLMPQYMAMDMDMSMVESGMGHGGHGHGSGHAHDDSISGLGDTQVAALFRLGESGMHSLHGSVGLSVPTGDVDRKNSDGTYVHYGMQLGSGTWDFMPSLTYLGEHQRLSWGAQANAIFRLQDENDSGFAFGDGRSLTVWTAFQTLHWLSTSVRLAYQHQEAIKGHYNGPHNHSSPGDIQVNYGGEWLDLGIGFNAVAQSGTFAGVRLGLEWTGRIAEHYNGYQLGVEGGWNLSLSKSF